LVEGGSVVMQSSLATPEEVWQRIPEHHKRTIRDRKLKIYYADMVQIAREVASVADLQMRMQGIVLLGGFLKLTPYGAHSGMNADQVYEGVEKALRKYFGKRGDQVVKDNLTCVRRGYEELKEVSQDIIQREAVSV
jgi:pyruvate-ferredoxin/flavodoxin oxidoreductase